MGNGQAAEGLARGIRAIWSWPEKRARGVQYQNLYFQDAVVAMVRHRKARTALNTAVGLRVIEQ